MKKKNFSNGEPGSSFALWLMPEGPLANDLHSWIHRLANTLDGPTFEPHLTLLGGLHLELSAALHRTEGLAHELPPTSITTSGIALLPEYFRALVLPASVTPSLWRGHLAAHQLFQGVEPEAFFPHISLYYGDAPMNARVAALDRLGEAPQCAFTATSLHLIAAGPVPEHWRTVGSFTLSG